jgi:hypothetical protein
MNKDDLKEALEEMIVSGEIEIVPATINTGYGPINRIMVFIDGQNIINIDE